MKVAVVTGSSSGIGKQIALKLASNKYKVYGLSRTGKDKFKNFINIHVDVSNEEQVKNVINRIIEIENRIDLTINCAGYGISGAAEYESFDAIMRLIEVNLLGYSNVCCAVLSQMKNQHFGRIINISSVAAVMPIPFQAWYSVSKAGVNSYTMSIFNEVKPFGIEICAIMLGDVNTGFTSSRIKSIKGDDEYNGRISRSVSRMEHDEKNGYSAKEIADYIMKIAKKKNISKPLYTMGSKYKLVILMDHLFPSKVKNYFLYQIYGK